MKIIVLGGGNSTERDISLRSAHAVTEAVKQAGFETQLLDPVNGYDQLDNLNQTIIFPILHGQGGEDGEIQKELEKRHLPYLGSSSMASEICFDKGRTRQQLQAFNITVPKGDVVTAETYKDHPLLKKPHVLKVARGGSSIGTYIVRKPNQLDKNKVNEVFSLDSQAIIEELVEGVEITVPILDDRALPVIEILPPEGGEFDYENKYNGQSKEICPPVSISKEIQEQAQQLALKVHQTLGAKHLSRVDIMVSNDGKLVVLELNTMPGMTEQSLFPLSARKYGLTMPNLMKHFVNLVVRDYHINQ